MNTEQQAKNWRRLCVALAEERIEFVTPDGARHGCDLELEALLAGAPDHSEEFPHMFGDYEPPMPYSEREARGDGPMNYVPAWEY